MMPRSLRAFPTPFTLIRLAVLVLLAAATARAQVSFSSTHYAELSPINEVTPVLSEGRGLAFFKLDPVARTLRYYVAVIDLSGPVTQAGIYAAFPGDEGNLIRAITFESGKSTATGLIEGLTSGDVVELQNGAFYINIFTAQEVKGEIRGQIVPFSNLGAVLRPGNEVPPASESNGSGVLDALLDVQTRTLIYLIDWSEMTGKPTMAHFHQAFAGSAGPVIEPISLNGADSATGSTFGTWTGLTDTEISAILAGEVYVNLHTAQYSGGEIRSQLYPVNYYTSEVRLGSIGDAVPVGAGLVRAFLDRPLGEINGTFYVGGLSEEITKASFLVHPDAELISELNTGITADEWLVFDFFDPDTIRSWSSRGMYVDFQTGTQPLAARGVLTPAASNLTAGPVAAVPTVLPGARMGSLSAWYDRAGQTITFALPAGAPAHSGTLAIYSPLGDRVAAIDLSEAPARLPVTGLPAGVYFAQLVSDGVPVAVCRVPVLR